MAWPTKILTKRQTKRFPLKTKKYFRRVLLWALPGMCLLYSFHSADRWWPSFAVPSSWQLLGAFTQAGHRGLDTCRYKKQFLRNQGLMDRVGEAFLQAGGKPQAQLGWRQPTDRLWDSEHSPPFWVCFFIHKMGTHPLPCGVVVGSQREVVKLATLGDSGTKLPNNRY